MTESKSQPLGIIIGAAAGLSIAIVLVLIVSM